jgi:hypothetical protein
LTVGEKILALGKTDCRFPFGDPQHADFRFCGRPTAPGRVYCEHCCRLTYLPPRNPNIPAQPVTPAQFRAWRRAGARFRACILRGDAAGGDDVRRHRGNISGRKSGRI